MDGRSGVQQGGEGCDVGDFAVINLAEVHAVHVGTHNNGARCCGPDPPVAHDARDGRGQDADNDSGVGCPHRFEDSCRVTGQAVGTGKPERHQTAGESSA